MTVSDSSAARKDTERRPGMLRSLLWLVLIISASGNIVASIANLNVLVSVAFGLVTLTCGVALVVHHYRWRRAGR